MVLRRYSAGVPARRSTDATPETPRRARYYHTARTAHLERLGEQTPAWFFYSATRADFDTALAAKLPFVSRRTAWQVVVAIYRKRIQTIEVPEALAVAIWPQLILIHTAVLLGKILRISDVRIVSYAIENYPTDLKLREFSKLPIWAARLITRVAAGYLVATTSKIVFGTSEAEYLYRRLLGRAMERSSLRTELVWALPARRTVDSVQSASARNVVFLGTFEERKGIRQLIASWPHVLRLRPDAELLIMGKGPLIAEVRNFQRQNPSVLLLEDPPRDEIFRRLAAAKVLVLFSQPWKGFKEQVGLPIVEGLSFGCEIVTSNETGIATWLSEHGHRVLRSEATADVLADAIAGAVSGDRSRRDILTALPAEDGRRLADKELFRL